MLSQRNADFQTRNANAPGLIRPLSDVDKAVITVSFHAYKRVQKKILFFHPPLYERIIYSSCQSPSFLRNCFVSGPQVEDIIEFVFTVHEKEARKCLNRRAFK